MESRFATAFVVCFELDFANIVPISHVMLNPEQEDNQPSTTRHEITKCVRTEVYRYL
jgi:hypothetical protein